jgi:hypothetical protein
LEVRFQAWTDCSSKTPFFGGRQGIGSGIWTEDLTLARQVFYHLSHTPSPTFIIFAIVIFQKGSHIFAWGQPHTTILTMLPLRAGL